MTTMELSELLKLGFNRNEARVYLALIKFGKADASTIIRETKFHKSIVYDNLDKLIDKGIVTFVVEGKKRIFQIASSEMLIRLFEEKEKEIQDKKKIASSISKEIDSRIKNIPEKQEATIYRGISGIKSFYNDSLKGGDYVVFGAPQESIDILGELFWENYNLKRIKNKIGVRMIFNPSIRYHGRKLLNKYTKIKYFDKDFEPSTETHIQGDKVGIIVWSENPLLFLIHNRKVAESYMKFFEKMWKMAKK